MAALTVLSHSCCLHGELILVFHFLVKFRVEIIKIVGIQLILRLFQRFSESLEMDNFPGTQELKRLPYFRLRYHTKQVIINCPCLLLGCQILCQIGDGVSLGLEFNRVKGRPAAALGHSAVVWSI